MSLTVPPSVRLSVRTTSIASLAGTATPFQSSKGHFILRFINEDATPDYFFEATFYGGRPDAIGTPGYTSYILDSAIDKDGAVPAVTWTVPPASTTNTYTIVTAAGTDNRTYELNFSNANSYSTSQPTIKITAGAGITSAKVRITEAYQYYA